MQAALRNTYRCLHSATAPTPTNVAASVWRDHSISNGATRHRVIVQYSSHDHIPLSEDMHLTVLGYPELEGRAGRVHLLLSSVIRIFPLGRRLPYLWHGMRWRSVGQEKTAHLPHTN